MRRASLALALTFVIGTHADVARAHERFPAVLRLTFDADNASIVMASTTFGLLYSDSAGASWQHLCGSAVGAGERDVPAVVIDRAGAWTIGLVAGVVRTEDHGCSFEPADRALKDVFVSDLRASQPGDDGLYAVTSSSLQANGFYTSHRGEDFAPAGPSFGGELLRTLRVAPSDPEVIYLSAARPVQSEDELRSATVYRSDDGGDTFAAFPFALDHDGYEVLVMAVDPRNPRRVYAVQRRAGREPLLRSEDGGETFEEIFAAPGPLLGVALDDSGETIWVGGEQAGLYRSRHGESFESLRADLQVLCIEHAWDQLWVCDGSLTSGFQVGRSSDGGAHFQPVLRFAELERSFSCADGAHAAAQCGAELDDVLAELALFRTLVEPAVGGSSEEPERSARGCHVVVPSVQASGATVWLAVVLAGSHVVRRRPWAQNKRARRPVEGAAVKP